MGGTMHPLARVSVIVALGTCASVAGAVDFSIAPDISGGFGNYRWSISVFGAGATPNPPLYLQRGIAYSFSIAGDINHPFWIKTADSIGSANSYGSGLSANGVTSFTTITFNVPADAPDSLHYNCGNHAEMNGPINVVIFRNGFN
jgi:hypothetical protein